MKICTVRHIPEHLDKEIIAQIDQRLRNIAKKERVIIPLAIESGSRAWGFPSPDSDYDCRFVYIRSQADYLSLFQKRDVIETELTPVLDVNGWDLSKALRLMLKGNAVIIEWLTSPITYGAHQQFRSDFLNLCEQLADRNRIGQHYLHLAYSMRNRIFETPDDAPIKKLFYILRPVVALRWLRLHEGAAVAPMNFPTLCKTADLSAPLMAEIESLLLRKSLSRELGRAKVPALIAAFVHEEIVLAESCFSPVTSRSDEHIEQANVFFRQTVQKFEAAFA